MPGVATIRTVWIIACLIGEAAGISLVATVYAALDRGLLSHAVPSILAAGGWEGLCLGGAQAWVLRKTGIVPSRWIVLTVLGAAAGYGLSLLGGAGGGDASQAEPPLGLIVLLGAGMGLGMGAVMGALQWLAGKGFLKAGRWIVANMAGWAVAMAIIMLGASSVEGSWPLVAITLTGGISGGLAGAALGLLTGPALPRAQAW